MFEFDDVANDVIRFVGASLALQAAGAGAKNVINSWKIVDCIAFNCIKYFFKADVYVVF